MNDLCQQKVMLKGIRILVVDDKPDNIDFLLFLLEEYGASVTYFTEAHEALEVITSNPPDLIISDIAMPKMSGNEFISQVRALPLFKQIPAIALSAYVPSPQQKALFSQFQAYIIKPIDPLQFLAFVRQLL